jgi:hypothetical protein
MEESLAYLPASGIRTSSSMSMSMSMSMSAIVRSSSIIDQNPDVDA